MRIRPSSFSRAGALLVFLAGTAAHAQGKAGGQHRRHRLGARSAALVLLMTPGLALFYGGMVRRKNVLATLHAELHLPGAGQRPVGRCSATAWPSANGSPLHRRPGLARPERRRRRSRTPTTRRPSRTRSSWSTR